MGFFKGNGFGTGGGSGGNVIWKGVINVASDFPAPGDVQVGWEYTIGTNVTDNDPTKTNTNQSFLQGDEIRWDGSLWIEVGPKDVARLNVNQTFTGNNTFDTGLLAKGAVVVQQGLDSITLSNGHAVASGNVHGETTQGREELTAGGNSINGKLTIKNGSDANILELDTNKTGLESNIYYVGAGGNDTSDGKSLYTRVLTPQKAIDLISGSGFSNQYVVKVTDSATTPGFDFVTNRYVKVDAPTTPFLINDTNPGHIILHRNNKVIIGEARRTTTVAGDTVEFDGAGSIDASHLNADKIYNATATAHSLIWAHNGGVLYADVDEVRQQVNKTHLAIDINQSTYRGNHRYIEGKVFVGSTINSIAYIKTQSFDGDIEVDDNGVLGISILGNWDGNIIGAGAGSNVTIIYQTRSSDPANDVINEDAHVLLLPAAQLIGLETGLLQGCQITAGTTTQKYNVAEGWGYITNTYTNSLNPAVKLQYIPAVIDGIDPYTTTAAFTSLAVGDDGITIPQADSVPGVPANRDKILLGTLTHEDGTQITHYNTISDGDLSGYLASDLNGALGYVQVVGHKYKITPFATDSRLSISAGISCGASANGRYTAAHRKNPNYRSSIAKNPMVIIYVFRDGLGGFLFYSTTTPQIGGEDPTRWDDGTVVTPGNPPNGSIISNQWSLQSHFKDPTNDVEVALYAQTSGYGTSATTSANRDINKAQLVIAPFILFFTPIADRIIQNNAAFDNSNNAMALTSIVPKFY